MDLIVPLVYAYKDLEASLILSPLSTPRLLIVLSLVNLHDQSDQVILYPFTSLDMRFLNPLYTIE